MRRGTPFEDLPTHCGGFTYDQLDYVSSARRFVQMVLARADIQETNPAVITLGHSLGSLLAALMAVEFGFSSLTFASGGIKHFLISCEQHKSNLQVGSCVQVPRVACAHGKHVR